MTDWRFTPLRDDGRSVTGASGNEKRQNALEDVDFSSLRPLLREHPEGGPNTGSIRCVERIEDDERADAVLLRALDPDGTALLVIRDGADVVDLDDDISGVVEVGEVGGVGLVNEGDVACTGRTGQERVRKGRRKRELAVR